MLPSRRGRESFGVVVWVRQVLFVAELVSNPSKQGWRVIEFVQYTLTIQLHNKECVMRSKSIESAKARTKPGG